MGSEMDAVWWRDLGYESKIYTDIRERMNGEDLDKMDVWYDTIGDKKSMEELRDKESTEN